LLLRSYTGRSESGARNAAVLGIVGFIAVPINYVSITWWQDKFQVHPAIRYSFGQTPHDPPAVVIALLVSVLAFTLLYAYLLLHAYRLQQLQTRVERLRIRAELD
ncbi:MAG TPA: hypothetical protein VKC57_00895, partial [Ktedonobacterales bacterium]|nr:hypothetical protein [Ktedonobacterales bacterium]